jgi:hypothetical protein
MRAIGHMLETTQCQGADHVPETMHGAGADERMCMMEDRLAMMQMMMDMMLDAPMMGTEGVRRGGPPPK